MWLISSCLLFWFLVIFLSDWSDNKSPAVILSLFFHCWSDISNWDIIILNKTTENLLAGLEYSWRISHTGTWEFWASTSNINSKSQNPTICTWLTSSHFIFILLSSFQSDQSNNKPVADILSVITTIIQHTKVSDYYSHEEILKYITKILKKFPIF